MTAILYLLKDIDTCPYKIGDMLGHMLDEGGFGAVYEGTAHFGR